MRAFFIFSAFIVATPAQAYCYQSSGYDTTSFINGAIQYLVCLHNEQNDTLDKHADAINESIRISNQHANVIDGQGAELRNLRSEIDLLRSEVEALQREISRLRASIP